MRPAAAVSLGVDVTLVWFDRALDLLASGQLHEDASGLERAARLFAEARETGRVRMLACSASMVGGKGPPEAVRQRVDGIVDELETARFRLDVERSRDGRGEEDGQHLGRPSGCLAGARGKGRKLARCKQRVHR